LKDRSYGIKGKGSGDRQPKPQEASKRPKGASSSAAKADPARRFGEKVVEPHG
ncbi:hypothetical protein HAX54_039635, partial [Datura stramonium]|nr:hypothetical protein [Datura stramonium]